MIFAKQQPWLQSGPSWPPIVTQSAMLLPPPRRYHRIMSQPLVVEQSRAIPVVFGRFTRGCARQALEELSKQLVR